MRAKEPSYVLDQKQLVADYVWLQSFPLDLERVVHCNRRLGRLTPNIVVRVWH